MPILWSLIISGLIILFSSFIRGTTGFGLALTAFPLLSLFLPVRDAVVLVAIVNLIFSIVHILRERTRLMIRDVIIIGSFSLAGVFIGFLLLRNINENVLRISTGAVIILCGIAMIKGMTVRISNNSVAYGVASLLGGILAGSITIGGPIVAIILTGASVPRDRFRNTMSIFFLFSFSFSVTFYIAGNMVDSLTSLHALVSLPFLVTGLLLGEMVARRINPATFRRIVLYLLLLMGTIIILKSTL